MLTAFLWSILEAAGFIKADLQSAFDHLKLTEPDLAAAIAKFQDIIFPKLAELLDRDTAFSLVKRIGAELASGYPGYDPDHWTVA